MFETMVTQSALRNENIISDYADHFYSELIYREISTCSTDR